MHPSLHQDFVFFARKKCHASTLGSNRVVFHFTATKRVGMPDR